MYQQIYHLHVTIVVHCFAGNIVRTHIHTILLVAKHLKLAHIWSMYLSQHLLLLFLSGAGVLLIKTLDADQLL